MMYYQKDTCNAKQTALSSFSCDVVFFFDPLLSSSSDSAQSVLYQSDFLSQQFVHLLLLSSSQHIPQTAYALDNLGKAVA